MAFGKKLLQMPTCEQALPGRLTVMRMSPLHFVSGHRPNPTNEEACAGLTGHNEVVRVVYEPAGVEYTQL
jgi:peptide methionine sulfoxide reductase MsrA